MRAAFLDRDGTLIWEPPETRQVDSLEKLRILPGVVQGLGALRDAGLNLVLVSNQDGLGTDRFPEADFRAPQRELERRLADTGIAFERVLICPHREEEACACRKPAAGLVESMLPDLEAEESLMVGDRETDRQFASGIGVPFVKMATNHHFPRFAWTRRETRETAIRALVNLDGSGRCRISTGIGFFDHMLELLSRHALIDLDLECRGDLDVDEHHTVEDTALVLGQVVGRALGDKRSIERYGFWLPMDEALARAVLDLSGRPCLRFNAQFRRQRVGQLPTELVSHFFASLVQTLGCTLHLDLERGENEHHKIEALFKAAGRALRMALRHCPHEKDVPSTKGLL